MSYGNSIEIIPEAQFLNFLGQFLIADKPDRQMVEGIATISRHVDIPEFLELSEIAEKILKDEKMWKRFENIHNHHFLIPAGCAIPLFSSQLYFSRIKPDFYNNYLHSLGLNFKQEGRKFPDHIGNELILLSIILSMAVTDNSKSVAKLGREMLRKFFIPHLDPISMRISNCDCDDPVNLYKPLFKCIKILYEEAKDILAKIN
ncbi:MAG: hypothetical protein D6732_02540 [Methanobacteriota archaeon]|nr:MAG: hypothetical protein D6732_02540 [Euryarchaeota archaeon]